MGLIDHVVSPLALETTLREVATRPHEGPAGPKKKFPVIAEAFGGDPPALLAEGYQAPTPEAASLLKAVKAKAPMAVGFALDLIGRNEKLSDREAYANELEFVEGVFATEDALVGLKSAGRERPVFKGK